MIAFFSFGPIPYSFSRLVFNDFRRGKGDVFSVFTSAEKLITLFFLKLLTSRIGPLYNGRRGKVVNPSCAYARRRYAYEGTKESVLCTFAIVSFAIESFNQSALERSYVRGHKRADRRLVEKNGKEKQRR